MESCFCVPAPHRIIVTEWDVIGRLFLLVLNPLSCSRGYSEYRLAVLIVLQRSTLSMMLESRQMKSSFVLIPTSLMGCFFFEKLFRVVEVVWRHEGPSPKIWSWTKTLSPNIRYFVTILRFVAINALFGNLWTKNCFLGQKQCFMGKKCTITLYILHIKFANLQLHKKTTHLSRKK